MNSFESINLVADLVFGLAMLIYGFAAGLFVAGWALKKANAGTPNIQPSASASLRLGGSKSVFIREIRVCLRASVKNLGTTWKPEPGRPASLPTTNNTTRKHN
jgi:hypothetical protein